MAKTLERNPNTQNVLMQRNPSWMDKYQGADYGSSALMGIQDTLSGLFDLIKRGVGSDVSRLAGGAAAMGAMSGTPTGQDPTQNMQQASQKASADPFAAGFDKGLSKVGEEMAMQKAQTSGPMAAVQTGQELQMAQQQKQAMQNPNGVQQLDQNTMQNSPTAGFADGMNQNPNKPQTSPYGPSGFEQAKQQALNMAMIGRAKPQGVLSPDGLINKIGNFLFTPGGVDSTGNYTPGKMFGGLIQETGAEQLNSQQAYNAQPSQQMKMKTWENNQPLSLSERQKLDIQGMNEFYKNLSESSNKPLSAESSKLLANVNSGLTQLDSMEKAFQKDPNAFKEIAYPGNQKGESIKLMTEDLTDILGRLRSGGAISKEEEKRFLGQLPKRGLWGNAENPKTVALKIKKLKSLFSDIKTTVEPRGADAQGRIQAALKAGATREQVYRIYKQGGF